LPHDSTTRPVTIKSSDILIKASATLPCHHPLATGSSSWSMRLAGKNADIARQRSHKIHRHDIHMLSEPHPCVTNGCSKAARHRGSLCEAYYADCVLDKDVLPIIYQGRPRFLQHGNFNGIRWTRIRSKIATWINQNFDLNSPRPCPERYPEMILIRGWKGSERGPCLYPQDSMVPPNGLDVLMAAKTK